MVPEQLREVIAGGETLNVEFKSDLRTPFSDNDLVEAVVCLTNRPDSQTAWLLIGVEDDGTVTGARARHEAGHTDPQRVTALIANRTRPSLNTRVWVVPIDNCEVIAIEIPSSRSPVGTTDGRYLRRAIGSDGRPACLPYHFHEMQSLQADRGLIDYSALVIPDARWDDLDPLEFERYRRTIRDHRGDDSLINLSDIDLAKSIGAVEANGEIRSVRVLGLLLFGREQVLRRFLPAHEVAFQVIRGQAVEVNDFFRWPLLRVMEELEARFRARNREQELLVGLFRVGIPDYPPAAFREGIANALIHRDYTRLGAVHVQWHEDRLEIGNPGGLPEGVRLDNLLVTQPRPRSPLLADAFKRADIVERTARGIDIIFYEQLRYGRPAPSYERSDLINTVLVLPGGKPNLNFVRLVVEQSQTGRALKLDELLLLNALLHQPALSIHEAAHITQKSDTETHASLNSLKEMGLIERRGEKQSQAWYLSPSTYRRLGETTSYTYAQDSESLQQERMILKYVQQHGRITRKEAAELCKLSPSQASRLLKNLAVTGQLVKHGERKGTWYEPAASL